MRAWERGAFFGVAVCSGMYDHDHIALGRRNVWGGERPFFMALPDRRQHTYVVGKTGTGKSSFLLNLIYQDIHAGRGVGVIDPHGMLADDVLACVPKWRAEDVVYFNPGDVEHPIAWNLLTVEDGTLKELVVSEMLGAFKSIWRDSWGPRLEYILEGCLKTLLECENVSLLGVSRLLGDREYRRWAVKQVKDPGLSAFWRDEFEQYPENYLREAIGPIQNKVGKFMLSPVIRNIFGQVRSKVGARFMMDNRRIFITDLAKGTIGEDKANLLGALLVTQFYQAALARRNMPEEEREDFHLVIDEVQSFATDSFEKMLSETRKFRLSLTLSHQYIGQLTEELQKAAFGNVGTIIAFRVDQGGAETLAREFHYTYRPEVFTGLDNYEICVKPLLYGEEGEPFVGKTFPPDFVRYGRSDKIIKRSRERYTMPRVVVEDKLRRWMQVTEKPRRRNGLRRKTHHIIDL